MTPMAATVRRLSSLLPADVEEDFSVRVADNFYTHTSGFSHKHAFEQDKKATDIVAVLYNDRMRLYVLVDVRGITTWRPQAIDESVRRSLTYPKYVYRKFVSLVFARRYNVYFALSKDFCLEVLNRDFDSICTVDAEMRNTTFMVFDHAQDELITGGMEGLKIWKYGPSSKKVYGQIKPMSNYELTLKVDLSGRADVSSVKIAEVDSSMGYLFCCSDTDVACFSLRDDARLLCKFTGAHKGGICGCVYSPSMQLLVTAAADTEIKTWNFSHGYTGTLTGHSRRITALLLHPDDSRLILTSAMDGSVRLWSLAVMECLYQVQVLSSEGIRWMGFGDPGQLFVASQRQVLVYNMSYLPEFWAHQRGASLRLQLVGAEGKTTRLMSISSDSSVHFFSRRSREPLSTVLTPPCISPLSQLRDFAYSRPLGLSYLLVDSRKLWVYLSRSNPASLVARWSLAEVQAEMNRRGRRPRTVNQAFLKELGSHRALMQPLSKDSRLVDCTSVACLSSAVVMWSEAGEACPPVREFLLLGLEDGRILFMDPVEKALRYLEFTAGKDAVLEMRHDRYHSCLVTRSLSKHAACLAVWDLPGLELMHEVICPSDLVGFARLQDSLITGHSSGHVYVHQLEPAEDNGPSASRTPPTVPPSLLARRPKPDHAATVVAVDSCPGLSIFLSVSSDGVVKLWTDTQILLSEVILEEPVVSAVFLDSQGDVLLSMKSHLFLLPHDKLMSGAEEEVASVSDVAESEIIEDPAIKYEGIVADPDPVDLDNYLSPFRAELSVKFTESPVRAEETEEEEEETESEPETVVTGADEALLSPLESVLDGSITETDQRFLQEWTHSVHGHRRPGPAYEYELPSIGVSPVSSPLLSEVSIPTPAPSEPETLAEEEEEAAEEIRKEPEKPPPVKAKPPAKKAPKSAPPAPESTAPPRRRITERLEAVRIDPSDIPEPRQPPVRSREALTVSKTAPELDARAEARAPSRPRRAPPERKKRAPKAPAKRRGGGKAAAEAAKTPGPRRSSTVTPSGPAPRLTKVDIGEAKMTKDVGVHEVKKPTRKPPAVLEELLEDVSDYEEDESLSATDALSDRPRSIASSRRRTPFLSTPDSTRLSAVDSGVPASGHRSVLFAERPRTREISPSPGLTSPALPLSAAASPPASVGQLSPPPSPPRRLSDAPAPAAVVSDDLPAAPTPSEAPSATATPRAPMSILVRRPRARESISEAPEVPSPAAAREEEPRVPVSVFLRSRSGMTHRDALRVFGPDYARLLELHLAKYLESLSEHPYYQHKAARDSADAGHSRLPVSALTPEADSGAWGADSDAETELLGIPPRVGITRLRDADSDDLAPPQARPSTAVELGRPHAGVKADAAMLEELQWALHLPRPPAVLPGDAETDPEFLRMEHDYFQRLNAFYEKLLLRYQTARPETPMEKLLYNDGVSAMAPDQQIERHILLRLRRTLRQHSAAERRRGLIAEQEERRRALRGHRFCAYEPREGELPPPSRPSPSRARGLLSSRPSTSGVDKDRREKKLTPFRFTLGAEATQDENLVDLKARDEMRLRLRAKYTAPSIPSKCSRYALISHPPADSDLPTPSLTEERLIRDRFPQFKEQWVGEFALLEPKPWMLALRHSS